MTGNERFNAVIDGKKPDKPPIYFTAVACTVASEILGYEAHTGTDSLHFKEELALFYGEQAHREFEEKHLDDVTRLWKILDVDVVREVWRSKMKPSKRLDEYTLLFGDENNEYMVKRFFPESQTYGVLKNTYRQPDSSELAEKLEHELAETPELPIMPGKKTLPGSVQKLFTRMGDNYGRIVSGGSLGFSIYNPNWLELLVYEPELVERYLLRHARRECQMIKNIAAQGYRWFSGGGDFAGNNGPFISPQSFREVFLRPIKLMADTCAELGAVYCYRSDGNLWPVFDDMFKTAGVQAYGEVDRDASMKVGAVLERCPHLIVLGNTSSALLVNGTEKQVREDTRCQLEEAANGRFIPGPSNAVVHGTPVRNVFAMLEELRK